MCTVNLHPHTITAEEIKQMNPKGIIFSGGPNSVYDEKAFRCDEAIFDLGLPIIGICYGMQLMTLHFGGKVELLHIVNMEKRKFK